jgi:hypothetical protein
MIKDARAQVDLIAALHLEALFKMGHLESPGDQSDSQQLRLKTAMGQDESIRTALRSHPKTQQQRRTSSGRICGSGDQRGRA